MSSSSRASAGRRAATDQCRFGILLLFSIITMMMNVRAMIYTVGDASGWAIGIDYTSWTASKTFTVGDTFVFNYPAGHTVDEVSAGGYKSCGASGSSISTDTSGATSVVLKTAGAHYFICTAPSHCTGGMKLAVTVSAAGSPSSSPAATSPGSGGATTTAPPALTTTTMAPPIAGTAGHDPLYSTTSGMSSAGRVEASCAALAAAAAAAALLVMA